MNRVKGWKSITVSILYVILIIVGGSPVPAAAETSPLKVALLPIFDVLPFYVAESKGYFASDDIRIEALSVNSALERDQLMQAGAIDGMLNEMISAANFNRETVRVQVVGLGRTPIDGAPQFRVLAAPDSGLEQPADMAGVPVAVSANTIIEYVTGRLLQARGVAAADLRFQSVPLIPERYQLLLSGQIRAATLPDPLGASAMQAGAVEIVSDNAFPRYAGSVLTFSRESLTRKAAAVRFFLAGWYRAVTHINADPQSFRGLVLQKIRVPGNIRDTFTVPKFPQAGVPDADQWADVIRWMQTKGLLSAPIAYDTSVTTAFLPVR
jgi:NitT/TauT family transport system substrate-binding protein